MKKEDLTKAKLASYIKNNEDSTLEQIADYFNISQTCLKEHLSKWGIKRRDKRRSVTSKEIRQLAMANPTSSNAILAGDLGVGIGTINREEEKLISVVMQNVVKDELIVNYIKEHPLVPYKVVARELGYSTFYVRYYILTYETEYDFELDDTSIEDRLLLYLDKNPYATNKEIAYNLALNNAYVTKLLKKYCIKKKKRDEIDLLKLEELYLKGINDIQILSELLKVSKDSVNTAIEVLELKYKERENARKDLEKIDTRVLEFIVENHPELNLKTLSNLFSVNKSVMEFALKRFNIPFNFTRRKQHYKEYEEKLSKDNIEKLIAENPDYTLDHLGAVLGVDNSTLSKRIKKYGIQYKNKWDSVNISYAELANYVKENPRHSAIQISRYYNITETTLKTVVTKLGMLWTNFRYPANPIELRLQLKVKESKDLYEKG